MQGITTPMTQKEIQELKEAFDEIKCECAEDASLENLTEPTSNEEPTSSTKDADRRADTAVFSILDVIERRQKQGDANFGKALEQAHAAQIRKASAASASAPKTDRSRAARDGEGEETLGFTDGVPPMLGQASSRWPG
ncbi:unnamed protein product [Durusdinium trenchii]|uniref:Uncharacterized protein n=1 Tax=Durusdinium trenchii TaxID=1381693 RepID=A0ABP0N2M5_9DINO